MRFSGIRADGVGVTGEKSGAASEIAAFLYRKGYRRATVTDDTDREVGAVCHDDNGIRCWWGEAAVTGEHTDD